MTNWLEPTEITTFESSLHVDENLYAELEFGATFIPVDRTEFITTASASRETYGSLKSAERVVKTILQGDGEYTQLRTNKDERHTLVLTRRGSYVAAIIRNFPFETVGHKVLSVRLELFKQVVGTLGGPYVLDALPAHYAYSTKELSDPKFISRCRARYIQRVVSELQSHGKSRIFRNALKRAEESSKDILKKFVAVVTNLFECYSALEIIRVDLSYRLDARSKVDVKTAKQDMRRFLNHIRHRTQFEHLVGYLWKFEEGVCDGLHFHCFFFFDGEKVKADIHYSHALGEFWKTLTGGRGCFHSCNAKKASYRFLGIGKVHHADIEMHKALYIALDYFSKMDQAISDAGVRSYGFSKPVQPTPKSKGGRPRIVVAGSPFASRDVYVMPVAMI